MGVEAVIDKDHASALLSPGIEADYFVMATDADAVYLDFGTPEQRAIARAHPDALLETAATTSPPGSMLPKVQAACEFATSTGRKAAIGGLSDIEGDAGRQRPAPSSRSSRTASPTVSGSTPRPDHDLARLDHRRHHRARTTCATAASSRRSTSPPPSCASC